MLKAARCIRGQPSMEEGMFPVAAPSEKDMNESNVQECL